MTTPAKKFVVFTATGDQGSSVCKYMIKEGYHVVGITRSPESKKAQALSALGVEVAKGYLDEPKSYSAALEGLYGAFVNTDFWSRYFSNGLDNHEAAEYETKQGKAAIEACIKAGAKHVVYSAIEHVGIAPHMDSKARVTQWASAQNYPITYIYTSHYLSNLVRFDMLKKADDGTYTLSIAAPDDCPLPNFAVEQTGGWVAAILKNPKKYIGARVDACSEVITVGEWAATLAEVSGKTIRTLGIPGGESYREGTEAKKMVPEELYLNFLAFYNKLVSRDVEKSQEVYPEQWDTKAWLLQSKEIRGILQF